MTTQQRYGHTTDTQTTRDTEDTLKSKQWYSRCKLNKKSERHKYSFYDKHVRDS